MFWFGLDTMGQRGIGEVQRNFRSWATRPSCRSFQGPHAAKRADNVCQRSPLFTQQDWQKVNIKNTTRGKAIWEVKSARVHILDTSYGVAYTLAAKTCNCWLQSWRDLIERYAYNQTRNEASYYSRRSTSESLDTS